jgi:HPt (histidine-containing phosphotransfer) domain-containing protein
VLDVQGNAEYVLAASIPLDGTPLAADAEDSDRLYYVMTADGYLVSHPQHERITRHVNEAPELKPAAAIGLQGFEGWRHIDSADRVYAFARLKGAPWIVGVQAADSFVFRMLNSAHDQLILTATALAAASLIVAWFASRYLQPPSDPRSEAAGASAASDAPFDLAAPPTAAPTEAHATRPARPGQAAPAHASIATSAPASHALPKSGSAPASAKALASGADGPTAPGPVSGSGAAALDLDAFMLQNFTTDEQRRSFISTVAASLRKLPADAATVAANIQSAPPLLHTLKGAWGSLGAAAFAHAASELEAAIKQHRPTEALLDSFKQEARTLQDQLAPWLSAHGEAGAAPASPSAELLPLLKVRNINASSLYESSRQYWNAQLGDQAQAFSAAMDALDFSTAERLLSEAASATTGNDPH